MDTFNSLRDAATYAGVSYVTVRRWCERHRIGVLMDGRWRIPRADLDRILAAHRLLKAA